MLTFFTFRMPFSLLARISSEVAARTNPSLPYLGISLASGVAAAYALAHPRLSAALPGVTIATVLIPPTSTIGIPLLNIPPYSARCGYSSPTWRLSLFQG